VETWVYDDFGSIVAYTVDDGSDGVVDETWANTWDGDNLIQSTLALGADPDVDIVYTGTYVGGRRQTWVADVGVDGDLDELWTHTWTGDHEHVEADLNGDGDIDRVEDRVWDGDRMMSVAVDAANDGAFEQITAWTYDADGRITSLIIELITLPTTTTVTALTAYDVEGREVTYDYSFDALSDGLLEYVETRVTTWVCRP
jgi:serralysin